MKKPFGRIHYGGTHRFTKAATSGDFHLIRKFAAPISLAVVFSGLFSPTTQSVEAKTSPDNLGKGGNYFVPPPPPYIPSMVASASGMTKAQALQALKAGAAVTVIEKVARSKQSVQAKSSRSNSRRAGNFFVPPPPPYTASMVPWAPGMTYAQNADGEKPVNPYRQYISTRSQGDTAQGVQPNPYVSYDRAAETRILKHIESFDSEISSHEKEIGKLLNL